MNPFLIGGAAGAALFVGLSVARFEHDAARDIRRRLHGPSPQVQVRVSLGIESLGGVVPKVTIDAARFSVDALPFHTEPRGGKSGVLKRLRLDLRDFYLAGLHVESIEADVPNCRFDASLALEHHKFRLTRSGTGPVTVRVRDSDFEPVVLRRYPEIRDVAIRMDHGRVTVDGAAKIAFLSARFHVEAGLTVRNGTELALVDPSVRIGDHQDDPQASAAFLKTFDSLLDLDQDLRLEHAITVDSVELDSGFLVATGHATIPPEQAGAGG